MTEVILRKVLHISYAGEQFNDPGIEHNTRLKPCYHQPSHHVTESFLVGFHDQQTAECLEIETSICHSSRKVVRERAVKLSVKKSFRCAQKEDGSNPLS
ncbi:hypothetical protein CEXT_695641 [Caerostris extrusa]|uniref:Uncharacterized protein n=1 Tax=Caerostris extrusa TaxID=172846 RepID=A0AAV4SQD7_CAEEX|nr:hypothetical protein CEXT_695641 [Caerostris extrusa]